MPRRQILSSEKKERLLVVPDDEVLLTRMCFLSEHDLALINNLRRPANRPGFAILLCYLRGPGFPLDKSISPHDEAPNQPEQQNFFLIATCRPQNPGPRDSQPWNSPHIDALFYFIFSTRGKYLN